ncbi:MAG: ABC transporter ATP-binding protein [Corynebacteriales bacterium]|nr:ABC transporter ATP-binding protein [Mycobacteriales bacterium]
MSTWQSLKRGMALTPGLAKGLSVAVILALIATLGRVAVPVVVQLVLDDGADDVSQAAGYAAAAAVAIVATLVAAYAMSVQLVKVAEGSLAKLRAMAFRRIHDLSMRHQQEQQRGSLVSRVTGDVDTVSQFLQNNGVFLLISVAQLVLATIAMAWYSPVLTLLVLAAFAPLIWILPRILRPLAASSLEVRKETGDMLGAVSEAVIGGPVVRSYGVTEQVGATIDKTVRKVQQSQIRTQRLGVFAFSAGELAAGVAMVAIVVAGVLLGVGGKLTLGEFTAFLFLVTLFVAPVQLATEVLNEAQNAAAGYRRVLEIMDMEPDVVDPGETGQDLPPGPVRAEFADVSFEYVSGRPVLTDVTVNVAAGSRVAIVGQTGSGKTTFAKLLTRLMDPSAGRITLSAVPLEQIRFNSLRKSVVMVPQDGFLFDATILENVRFGRLDASNEDIELAFEVLGLADWLSGLPAGLYTEVGERGESLSAGERQLVAIVRAYLADPALLVLDEATSAVDPATEQRLARALDTLTHGRTTVTIAHRLSTAEQADEVLVFEAGALVQRGHHLELVAEEGSIYANLHASWRASAHAV